MARLTRVGGYSRSKEWDREAMRKRDEYCVVTEKVSERGYLGS